MSLLICLNLPAPLAQFSALPLQQCGPSLQTSAVNPPPPISALLLKQAVLILQPSDVRADPPPPPLSVLIKGRGGYSPLTLAVFAHDPLLSASLSR